MTKNLTTKKFTADFFGETSFSGRSTGQTWNGWACPYFSFAEGSRIVSAQNKIAPETAYYDDGNDSFVFKFDDEVEQYQAEKIDGLTLYAIGSSVWVWEEAD
jgi:hypothetical protein